MKSENRKPVYDMERPLGGTHWHVYRDGEDVGSFETRGEAHQFLEKLIRDDREA
jgi:hypothetical protein